MNRELPDSERIFVTGMGAVTPVGASLAESWNALIEGKHGIVNISEDSRLSAIEGLEDSDARVAAPAADVSDLLSDPYLNTGPNRKLLRVKMWHPSAKLGFLAMYEALKDADLFHPEEFKLDSAKIDSFRAGFYLGSTFSGVDQLGEVVGIPAEEVRLHHLMKYLPARAATAPAMPLGLNGPGGLIAEECASGGSAIRLGAKEMYPYWGGRTDADVMVVGGTDAELSRYNLLLFGAAGAAVDNTGDPESASRPLDADRHGLVMGEGSGALVLETLTHAKARGVKDEDIHAELVGHANLTHAQNEQKAGLEGAKRVIVQAMRMGSVALGETVYINGHFTSTGDGDPIEATAINLAVEELGLRRSDIWLNSSKAAIGHTMGAAGAIEAAVAIKALSEGIVPPALKLHNPIPEVAGYNLSPLQSTQLSNIDAVVSTSFGFGGTAAALAFRKYQP